MNDIAPSNDNSADAARRQKAKADFKNIDRLAIGRKSNPELAAWQAGYQIGDPQYILAEHEWQRRLNVEQIKSNRFSAFLGLGGVIIGVILTYLLSLPCQSPTTSVICQERTQNNTNATTEHSKKGTPNVKTKSFVPAKKPNPTLNQTANTSSE